MVAFIFILFRQKPTTSDMIIALSYLAMRKISGCILVQGSNVGVPNLVVSAHDARDVADSAANERTLDGLVHQLGRRLGSVLTDDAGQFVLSGEDLQFEGNEARSISC